MKSKTKRSSELNQTSNITNTTTNASTKVPASVQLLLHTPSKQIYTIPAVDNFEVIKADEFVLVTHITNKTYHIFHKEDLQPITSQVAKVLFL